VSGSGAGCCEELPCRALEGRSRCVGSLGATLLSACPHAERSRENMETSSCKDAAEFSTPAFISKARAAL